MSSTADFSPYRRSTVGYDRLFDHLEHGRSEPQDGYPQVDLERLGEDSFRITLAVPGFDPEDIEVVSHQSQLTISGKQGEPDTSRTFLHRGIVVRPFERRFELADYVQVQEANLDKGLLYITLKRVIPEAMKPHRVPIGGAQPR